MDKTKFAFEIKTEAHFALACALWPHLHELEYERVRLNFFVFTLDQDGGYALYGPGAISEHVEKIEPGPIVNFKMITLK